MGTRFKCFIIVAFTLQIVANAQEVLNYRFVDSITYSYYKAGDWNKLIDFGNKAIDQSIDYKYLRQRIGYAYFSMGNYFEARKHFEKAFSFDSYDAFTLEYLYYLSLNTGREEYAEYYTVKMTPELRQILTVKTFQPVKGFDIEYNYKFNTSSLRSNPQYYRFGICTRLGDRFGLYQMISNYVQSFTIQNSGLDETTSINQTEYYALLKFTFSNHWIIKTAYHFVNTISNSTAVHGNLGLLALSAEVNGFTLEANVSVFNVSQSLIKQAGIKAGFVFPGKSDIYLTSALSETIQPGNYRFIYNQTAGFKLLKIVWIEGNFTLGNLTNYNDFNALYIYNTDDPTTLGSGVTAFLYIGKHITIWTNYTYERKEFSGNSINNYNQYSYLGGIRWKL